MKSDNIRIAKRKNLKVKVNAIEKDVEKLKKGAKRQGSQDVRRREKNSCYNCSKRSYS